MSQVDLFYLYFFEIKDEKSFFYFAFFCFNSLLLVTLAVYFCVIHRTQNFKGLFIFQNKQKDETLIVYTQKEKDIILLVFFVVVFVLLDSSVLFLFAYFICSV